MCFEDGSITYAGKNVGAKLFLINQIDKSEANQSFVKPRGMVFTAKNKTFWNEVNNNLLPIECTQTKSKKSKTAKHKNKVNCKINSSSIPNDFASKKPSIRIQSYTYRR
jgi:hypothetical protein